MRHLPSVIKSSYLPHWIFEGQRPSSYSTINCVNSLYLIINKINGYTEESSGSNYLVLVPIGESKYTIKSMRNCGTK